MAAAHAIGDKNRFMVFYKKCMVNAGGGSVKRVFLQYLKFCVYGYFFIYGAKIGSSRQADGGLCPEYG